jgi:hypothetical protein
MADEEDFLAAVEADNAGVPAEELKDEPEKAEPEAEPAKEPEQPAPVEQAPPEPATPPEAAPAAPEAQTTPPSGFVPLSAVLDERDKRKAIEAQLAALQPQQPQQAPDPFEDPEGFAAFQEERTQTALLNHTLNTSERFARKEHGTETVDAAKTWALDRMTSDPLYRAQVLRDPDPYERVVADYRREQLFSKVSDPSEFDAFLAWKQAQATIQQPPGAPPAAPPNQAPAIPQRSLASAPSAGGITSDVVQGDDEIFAETFDRKT